MLVLAGTKFFYTTRLRKPRHNKAGEDPSQKLIEAHGLNPHYWGWALNEVNSFVLLENAFPDDDASTTFVETRVFPILSGVKKPYTDLLAKVDSYFWYL